MASDREFIMADLEAWEPLSNALKGRRALEVVNENVKEMLRKVCLQQS